MWCKNKVAISAHFLCLFQKSFRTGVMTIKDRLEEKVRKYLTKQGTPVVEDAVCYTGIMQDMEMPDGQILPMHMVRYQSWVVRKS